MSVLEMIPPTLQLDNCMPVLNIVYLIKVLLGNATFLTVASDLASISLSNIAPCVVHWDSFVVWDRQIP